MSLTEEYIKTIFIYKDGNLLWKKRLAQCVKIGEKAGSLRKDGYIAVQMHKKIYKLHQLIFLYHYGYIPKEIDHIDRNPSNNKIENLREATRSLNTHNSTNKSKIGYPGVSKTPGGKYQASIKKLNNRYYLGTFDTPKEAYSAYKKKACELYG